MPFDLLQSAKGLFSSNLIQHLTSHTNESEGTIQKALSGIVPSLLGGIIGKSETESGANVLMNTLSDAHASFGHATPENLLNNPSLLNSGWDFVKNLFGSQSDNFLGKLTSFSGAKVSSITGILGLAAPLIFRLLGNHASSNGLNAKSLAGLLSANKASVLNDLPQGLDLKSVFSNAFAFNGKPNETAPQYSTNEPTENSSKGGMKWLLPLLLFLLLGALLFWYVKKKNKAEEMPSALIDSTTIIDANTTVPTMADPATLGVFDSATGDFNYNAGNEIEIKLGDKILKVGENSTEARLFQFLSNGDVKVDTIDKSKGWMVLDRVYFETGKNVLKAVSVEQLKNISEIIKAFPAAKVKFGGYTDNTGDSTANVTLSANRALAALNSLSTMGIDIERIKSEGYGSLHAIADNATKVGRALNRRVDIRVTEK